MKKISKILTLLMGAITFGFASGAALFNKPEILPSVNDTWHVEVTTLKASIKFYAFSSYNGITSGVSNMLYSLKRSAADFLHAAINYFAYKQGLVLGLEAFSAQETQVQQTAFNVLKPQLMNVLFKKYDDEFLPFFNLVMTLGEVKAVAGPQFGHYEIGWIHRSFRVQSNVASPGTGNTITMQVSLLDVTQGAVYPQVRDRVKFKDGVTSGTIIAVANPSTNVWNLTIAPQQSTMTIPALTAGDTIIIGGSTFGEGTNAPMGRVNPAIQYLFNTQIIKQAGDITGSALSNQTWYDAFNDGKSAMPFPKLQLETEYRMLQNISYEMLFADPTDTAQQAVIGSTTMTGIFPWATAGGNSLAIAPGTFSISHFDQLNRVFDKRRASSEYLWAAGPDQYRDVENGLQNVFTESPNLLGQAGMNSKFTIGDGTDYGTKYGVSFNFKCVQKTNRTYYFTTIPQLSAEQLGGAPGFLDSYRAVIIPLGKGTDAKTGAKLSRLGYKFKEYGGINRMMKVTEHGIWANQGANDEFDHRKYNALHEGGTELFGVETWGAIKPF